MADQSSTHTSDDPQLEAPQGPGPSAAESPVPSSQAATGAGPEAVDAQAPSAAEMAVPLERQKTVIAKRSPAGQPVPFYPSSPLEMGVTLEGETLGHFKLEKFVGGGGMGAVFRAVDTMLDRTVAVKVLSRNQTDEEILRRFKNEAQSAARLDHENIARVFYVGEDKGWNYIVFEFIEGLNLHQLVAQRGPLPLDEAINYTLQVAEALEHAFQRDVVHRDIKPSNVLVTREGQVKLVDMGLARLHQVESPGNELTASGVTLGTFDYISPEQARDPRSADVRSDLYSLGCTLYFMLTGRPPFPDGTVLQKLLSHTSDERPDPRVFRPELPEEVVVVLNRLLARQPEDRYQQPSELIGELLLLSEQLGLCSAVRGTVWITPQPQPPGWLARSVPILLPLLLLMLGVWALDRFWPAPTDPLTQGNYRVRLEPPEAEEAVGPPQDAAPDQTRSARQPAAEPPPAREPLPRDQPLPREAPSPGSAAPPSADSGPGGPSSEFSEGSQTLPSPESKPAPAGQPTGPATPAGLEPSPDEEAARLFDHLSNDRQADLEAGLPPVRTLIVGGSEQALGTATRLVGTLDEAFKLAGELPDVDTIELWFDGPRVLQPLTLAVDLLTIRAGPGYCPQLVFRPAQRDVVSQGRMLSIVGGDVTWEGIDFRLELPAEPAEDWALFDLDQVLSLALRDCTLTIVNADEQGQVRQRRVAFFSIQRPQHSALSSQELLPMDRQTIILNRCVARGEATVVLADHVTPFTLNWEQGLLVTSQRLVETGGAVSRPEWHGHVEIGLQNVTAVVGKGLCLMRAERDAPYQLFLYVDSKNCIFLPASTAPLVEHRGVQSLQKLEDHMEFHGRFCFFPDRCIVWRLAPLDQADQAHVFQIDSEVVKTDWFRQTLPRLVTPAIWQHPPDLTGPVHLARPADYVLSNRPNNPAISASEGTAGFQPGQLPGLPPAAAEGAAVHGTPKTTAP